MHWFDNITLEGNLVKLIPMQPEHRAGLVAAASDGKLWEIWHTSVPSEYSIDAYMEAAFAQRAANIAHPFTVLLKETGKIIGSTRFCNAVEENRRLEIGYTWYAQSMQRTGVNTECKFLLLSYAFETLDCIAVEFLTNWHNHRSRAAIARLGAKQDGVLRNHRINADGSFRDTVVFSILNSEWLNVKKSLVYAMYKERD